MNYLKKLWDEIIDIDFFKIVWKDMTGNLRPFFKWTFGLFLYIFFIIIFPILLTVSVIMFKLITISNHPFLSKIIDKIKKVIYKN